MTCAPSTRMNQFTFRSVESIVSPTLERSNSSSLKFKPAVISAKMTSCGLTTSMGAASALRSSLVSVGDQHCHGWQRLLSSSIFFLHERVPHAKILRRFWLWRCWPEIARLHVGIKHRPSLRFATFAAFPNAISEASEFDRFVRQNRND